MVDIVVIGSARAGFIVRSLVWDVFARLEGLDLMRASRPRIAVLEPKFVVLGPPAEGKIQHAGSIALEGRHPVGPNTGEKSSERMRRPHATKVNCMRVKMDNSAPDEAVRLGVRVVVEKGSVRFRLTSDLTALLYRGLW